MNSRCVFKPIAAAFACFGLLAIAYAIGTAHGFDHPRVQIFDLYGFTVAISDIAYNLHLGYVGLMPVFGKLDSVLKAGGDINDALTAATKLGHVPVGYFDDHGLLSMYNLDLGAVDYDELAFNLFGLKIESLYNLHFLIIAVSTSAFIYVYRRSYIFLATVIAICFSLIIEVSGSIFTVDFPPFGQRQSVVLAVIPVLHLLLALITRQRALRGNLIAALVQIAILILAIRVRGTAAWSFVAVVAVCLYQFIKFYWPRRKEPGDRRLLVMDGLGLTVRWPVVLFFGLYWVSAVYVQMQMHPVYDSDDVVPYHALWHSLYMNSIAGFDYSFDKCGPSPTQLKTKEVPYPGDAIGYSAAMWYAKEVHLFSNPASYGSPLTGTTIRQGLHDKLMRRAFLSCASRNFGTFAEFYIKKPFLVVKQYVIEWWFKTADWSKLAGLGLGIILAVLRPWGREQQIETGQLMVVLNVMFVCTGIAGVIGAAQMFYVPDGLAVWLASMNFGLPLLIIGWVRRKTEKMMEPAVA